MKAWLRLLLPGAILLLVGAAIFQPFLFGNSVLLYKDIGSDSLISYYPDFVHLSNYIRKEGYPAWSFYVGMGQDLAYATGYLIWQPVTWLPQEWIGRALVFQHLGKVLLVGLLFFRFLRLRGLRSPAPLLGALLLSFSGYMSMAACWYPLADEVISFAALLLGVEEALQHERRLPLIGAVALVGMINPFYLYLCALFLLVYVPLRLYAEEGRRPEVILRVSLRLGLLAFLGAALGAFITLPYLYTVLHSPRGSSASSVAHSLQTAPILCLESARHYFTALMRPFSNDILGTGNNYRGWKNYLEAPITYCGLLPLLFLPQLFAKRRRRFRRIFLIFLAGLVVPVVFPWFRYLFWLFEGDYYRTYSLFCILGVIALSMAAFSSYSAGGKLNLWTLTATVVGLLSLLYWPLDFIDRDLRSAVVAYLILYAALLTAGQVLRRQKYVAPVLVGLVAIELVQFGRITVAQRKTVSKDEVSTNLGYNDESVEELRAVIATDHSFYRITKPRSYAPTTWLGLNDAMIFGYNGSSSYSSFNSISYTDFLTAVDAIPPNTEPDTRWSIGLLNHPLLSTFICEKYSLVDDPAFYRNLPAYEFVRQQGRDYLFQNRLFLPFGIAFTRYVTAEAFAQLPTEEKVEALFRAVVLQSRDQPAGLSPMTADELRREIKTTPLASVVSVRREGALRLSSFRQSRIEGSVSLEQPSVFVLQTPFDRGWRALANGHPVPVLKVDAGLLGLALDAGKEKIELRYRNPLLLPGVGISLAALFVIVLSHYRSQPRLFR